MTCQLLRYQKLKLKPTFFSESDNHQNLGFSAVTEGFRLHCIYTAYRCGLLLLTCSVISVCVSVTLRYTAKTAEPTEMPIGMWAQVGPQNHILDGGSGPPPRKGQFCGGEGAVSQQSIGNTNCWRLKDNWLDPGGFWHVNSWRPKRLCVRWEPRSLRGTTVNPIVYAHMQHSNAETRTTQCKF